MSNELKQTLVVTRFGELDTEWLDDLEREQRREALAYIGKSVISYPAVVGRNILYALSKLPENVGEY